MQTKKARKAKAPLKNEPNAQGVDVLLSAEQATQMLAEWGWRRRHPDIPVKFELRSGDKSFEYPMRLWQVTLDGITVRSDDGLRYDTPNLKHAEVTVVSIPPRGYKHVVILEWKDGTKVTLSEPAKRGVPLQ